MVVGLARRLEPTMHRTCQITIRTATFGKYQRYVLMDQRERYWTGDGWATDLRSALRHADILGAHQEYQRVMERLYQDKPVRTFEATIKVQVFTDQPFGVNFLLALGGNLVGGTIFVTLTRFVQARAET